MAAVNKLMREHDQITSRTTGEKHEIRMTLGHAVPRNPFASLAQAGFLHAHPEKVGGKNKLKEWDNATNFNKLPKKVKKK